MSNKTTATPPASAARVGLAQTVLLGAIYDQLADRAGAPRAELLLADAGMGYAEIAAVLGRKPEAVRSTLRRKASGRRAGASDG